MQSGRGLVPAFGGTKNPGKPECLILFVSIQLLGPVYHGRVINGRMERDHEQIVFFSITGRKPKHTGRNCDGFDLDGATHIGAGRLPWVRPRHSAGCGGSGDAAGNAR